jgi:peroxiredoxin
MKDKNEGIFTVCPVCKCPVKKKNLSRHLLQVDLVHDITEVEKKHETMDLQEEVQGLREELRLHKRQRNIVSILFIGIIMLLPVAYAITLPTEEISYSKIPYSRSSNPTLAPDFSSVDVVTGETISLTQLKGNIVLLNFVNYGCDQRTNQIVSQQLLDIKSLKEQRDDFIPVSVFCGCCPVETLRDFAVENELTWPWILDSDYSIIQKYLDYVIQYGYPTLVFIDKNQRIVDFSGYSDVSTLSVKIDKMLD